MKDGSYTSTLNVDGMSAIGTLDIVGNDGRGSDGRFQFEVHLTGSGHQLAGIINILLDGGAAAQHEIPHHFSMLLVGSGGDDRFNLIGHGPNGVIVEIGADWRSA